MTLLNAPEFDARGETRKRNILIGSGVLATVLVLVALAGFILGHGWFFMNLPVERQVHTFLAQLQAGDYSGAYGTFYNDPAWQQHPQKYTDYTLQRFTEDFSTESDWKAPVKSFSVNCSKRDESGTAVTATINGATKLTLKHQRSDGTLAFFPYQLACGF